MSTRHRPRFGLAFLVVFALTGLAPPAPSQHVPAQPAPAQQPPAQPSLPAQVETRWVGGEACAARLNALGVFVEVSPGGLATVDGPVALLEPHPAEWAGVRFEAGGSTLQGVATGNEADWAGRRELEPVSLSGDEDELVSVARLGELEVVTQVRYDADGPWLLAAVTLTNRGSQVMRNVLYAREWGLGEGEGFVFPNDLFGMPDAPGDIGRVMWMLDDLLPGASGGVGFSYAPARADPGEGDGPVEVPLKLWRSATYPLGLPIGETNGISWGDFDRDRFPDLYATESGNLWRNLGGSDWILFDNLNDLMPVADLRYGCSFGDFDDDGRPDIAIEPRRIISGDTCFHLLHNKIGVGGFADVADGPTLDVQPCVLDAETNCWADVDGDGYLDLFMPAYPAWTNGGPGNFFFYNLGPVGAGGSHMLTEQVDAAGLDNPPPDSARPEGAQFADIDADGDVDLYSNGTLYQNRSVPGTAEFDALSSASSGVGLHDKLEEGAMFFDYDMDGDDDLFCAYASGQLGVRIWENRGDGQFFKAEQTIIDAAFIGLGLGMSAEDWDNDGDIDFTTRQVFRRNQFIETGERHFTVATHVVTNNNSATPAWADWDRDGDLDCALGNFNSTGSFWVNTTYTPTTPEQDIRYVRVRVLRDSTVLQAGLETEFGAVVEIVVHGDPPGLRRRKFVASSHGYLNQNDYDLVFALPADATPDDESELTFDVVVSFPENEPGIHRVDRLVNPALGDIEYAGLSDREIRIFRSGRVRVDGVWTDPAPFHPVRVNVSAGGLALPSDDDPLPRVVPTPVPDAFVGLELDTSNATLPLRIRELVLDGQLDAPVDCGAEPFNIALWDLGGDADGGPTLVETMLGTTSARNARTRIPCDIVLEPGHLYRLIAGVTLFRFSDPQGPLEQDGLAVTGGLNFRNQQPCLPGEVVLAPLLVDRMYMAITFAPERATVFEDLGGALAGGAGTPVLGGSGELAAGYSVSVSLGGAPVAAPTVLYLGTTVLNQPFLGGTLVPNPFITVQGLVTDPGGNLMLSANLPAGFVGTAPLVLQAWIEDAGAPAGFSASNGLKITPPELLR